jgi:hypothetical protein
VIEVPHLDDLPVMLRKLLNCVGHLFVLNGFGSRSIYVQAMVCEQVFKHFQRLAFATSASNAVDATVAADSAEPGSQWAVWIKVFDRSESLHKGFLNDVVRIIRVPELSHRE